MKSLLQYINEMSQTIKPGSGIIVCDIDDTLLATDNSDMAVYKYEPGKEEQKLSTSEYAKDPDKETHPDWFSFRDMRNAEKITKSLKNGEIIKGNIKILNQYIQLGYKFSFLTARAKEGTVMKAICDLLQYKGKDGKLHSIKDVISKDDCFAVNDREALDNNKWHSENPLANLPENAGTPERKSTVLKWLCDKYEHVVYVDDDKSNLRDARKLKQKYPELKDNKRFTTIQAWNK